MAARVFLTGFVLSAALIVALALPYAQEDGAAATEAPATTAAAPAPGNSNNNNNNNNQFGVFQANCTQWQEQCNNNGNQIQNNAGQLNNQTVTAPPTPDQMNQVPNNTSAFCTNQQMIQMCGQGNINQIQNPINIVNTNQTFVNQDQMTVPTMQTMPTLQTIQPVQFNQSAMMPYYPVNGRK